MLGEETGIAWDSNLEQEFTLGRTRAQEGPPIEMQQPKRTPDCVSAADGDISHRKTSDRRHRPTPFLSRYTLRGRRKGHRRDSDPQSHYYVDRASGFYLTVLLIILGLIVFDTASTLYIISRGGSEANPLMAWALEQGTAWFILIKILPALTGFMLLGVLTRFPISKVLSILLTVIYGSIIVVHLNLLHRIHF